MMKGPVSVDRAGSVLWVTVDRPEARNALSRATLAALESAFRDHAGDPHLRLCILRGAGEKSFAAGGDLKELADARAADDGARTAESGKAATVVRVVEIGGALAVLLFGLLLLGGALYPMM